MDFKQKSEDELIIDFLTLDERILNKTPKYYSSFCAVLNEDTRLITGRINENTGSNTSWLGLCGYLILLDMIGKCLELKEGEEISENPIIKALMVFGEIEIDRAYAIYALRCALLHGYGLVNIPKKIIKMNREKLIHHFVLSSSGPMITFPSTLWDEKIENISKDNETRFNIKLFGDFIENMIARLMELAKNKRLKIALAGGKDEMIKKYFLQIG